MYALMAWPSLHPSKSQVERITRCQLWRLLERLQQVRLRAYQPQGWSWQTDELVLDSRSVIAHNACCLCVSYTARLLLLFLPTALLFQPQQCVFIVKSTRSFSMSLLLNCIFLWWELHPFTCFSCVGFLFVCLFVFACLFVFLHWNSVSQTQPSGSVSSADWITNLMSPF